MQGFSILWVRIILYDQSRLPSDGNCHAENTFLWRYGRWRDADLCDEIQITTFFMFHDLWLTCAVNFHSSRWAKRSMNYLLGRESMVVVIWLTHYLWTADDPALFFIYFPYNFPLGTHFPRWPPKGNSENIFIRSQKFQQRNMFVQVILSNFYFLILSNAPSPPAPYHHWSIENQKSKLLRITGYFFWISIFDELNVAHRLE